MPKTAYSTPCPFLLIPPSPFPLPLPQVYLCTQYQKTRQTPRRQSCHQTQPHKPATRLLLPIVDALGSHHHHITPDPPVAHAKCEAHQPVEQIALNHSSIPFDIAQKVQRDKCHPRERAQCEEFRLGEMESVEAAQDPSKEVAKVPDEEAEGDK